MSSVSVPNRQGRAELKSVIDRINGKYGPKCDTTSSGL